MRITPIYLSLIAGCAAMFALPVDASPSRQVNVDVPFAFMAGTTFLPAGAYQLQQEGTNQLLVRDSTNHVRAIVRSTPLEAMGNEGSMGEVVFNRHGSKYFLSQSHAHGMSFEFQTSKLERTIEDSPAKHKVYVGSEAKQ